MDEAPPKLEGLAALTRPDIQSVDEWRAFGTREDGHFFKDYDAGGNDIFGLKIKAIIMRRGSPVTRIDPERILRIVLDVDYAKARKSVLAGLGQEACGEEVNDSSQQACILRKPAASPADLDLLGVGASSDGLVTYECLYIDSEAQKRLDGLRDAVN
jgi:hypothetical protein